MAGAACIATGVGGVAGSAMICAGVNSIVGSCVSESQGGSSLAGWIGGGITGAICGLGAGLSGRLFVEATQVTGFACLGKIALSISTATVSGASGSLLGQAASSYIDGNTLNKKDALLQSANTGVVNIFGGIGAGMGMALASMPTISATSQGLVNGLNAAFSVFVESVCDFVQQIPHFF